MVIENIIKNEILVINKDIIKKRKSLKELLETKVISEKDKTINLNMDCLESIAKKCNLPLSDIFLPITFFIPAGSYEGYLISQKDSEVVESIGFNMYKRNNRYWIPKYQIRKLENICPGIFQSIIVP